MKFCYELSDNWKNYHLFKIILEEGDDKSEIIIPNMYNGKFVSKIAEDLFYEFGAELKSVVFGDNITELPSGLFSKSSGLQKIFLGKNINSVKADFSNCKYLKTIYFNGTPEEWSGKDVYGIPEFFKDYKIVFGTVYDKMVLKQDNKPLYPYTHWDCTNGKPQFVHNGVNVEKGNVRINTIDVKPVDFVFEETDNLNEV